MYNHYFLSIEIDWLFGVAFPFVWLGLKPYVAIFVINNFYLKIYCNAEGLLSANAKFRSIDSLENVSLSEQKNLLLTK